MWHGTCSIIIDPLCGSLSDVNPCRMSDRDRDCKEGEEKVKRIVLYMGIWILFLAINSPAGAMTSTASRTGML